MIRTIPTQRLLWLAIAAAILFPSAGVLARGKPAAGTPATLTFDDLAGDAIRSDGLGPYTASLENGVIRLATGKKRSIHFDFSTCLPGYSNCKSPFGLSSSDTISSVTAEIGVRNGGALFAFTISGEKFELNVWPLAVREIDDDDDGVTDRYVVESTDQTQAVLDSEASHGPRGTVQGDYYGVFSMPWGIEVTVD